MARYEIHLRPANTEELGIDRTPDPRLDVAASLDRYDALLEAAVQAEFPEAEIVWSERGLAVYDNDAAEWRNPVTDDAYAIMLAVSEIAEGLLGADSWAVETTA
jgi:hypothetical protein